MDMKRHVPLVVKRPIRRVIDDVARRRLRQRVGDVLFIWVPKTAGSSLWNALRVGAGMERFDDVDSLPRHGARGPITYVHMGVAALVAAGHVDQFFVERAFSFTFVRNPFDRLVSLYAHLRDHGRIDTALDFGAFVQRVSEGVESVGLINYVGLSQANPQVAWLRGADGGFLPDFVGRYESLGDDFSRLCEDLGIESRLRHLNRSDRDTGYRPYYDDTTRSIVESVYAEDLELFGYSF